MSYTRVKGTVTVFVLSGFSGNECLVLPLDPSARSGCCLCEAPEGSMDLFRLSSR